MFIYGFLICFSISDRFMRFVHSFESEQQHSHFIRTSRHWSTRIDIKRFRS